jgi:hypothetical protein
MISFRNAAPTAQGRALTPLFLHAHMALVLSIVLCSSLHALAQSAGSEEPQNEVIRGTVINSVTQAPIPRALVYSADNRYAALTDGDGHFEFTLPKQGSEAVTGSVYSGLQARALAFAGHQIPLGLMARKPGFLDLPDQVAEPSADNDFTISLLPEGIIKGRVAAGGSESAAGVMVQIFSREVEEGLPRWLPSATVRANSAGEFRFAELLPGSYKIATQEWMDNDPVAALPGSQLYGYPPLYYPGVNELAAGSTIDLDAGQTVEADLTISRQPYFPIRIPVATGDISGGFSVSVQGQHGSRYELGYNHAEQRIEGMLPSGNYVVQVASYGPKSASGSANIRIADAPLLQGPSLTLTPNSSIPLNVKEEFTDTRWSGFATSAEGKNSFPLRGPRLYLQANLLSADDFSPGGGPLRPPTAPNDDALVLDTVPPGRYWLRLSTSRGYVASATMGSTDLLKQPLVVGSGASAPIDITMRDDGAQLEGTVGALGEQNASSSAGGIRAWVYCVPLPESSGQFQQFSAGDDGKFNLQMMAPGDYRILAFSKPQLRLPYRDAEAMKAYESKGQVVHLSAGQKTTVQVQIISVNE